MQKQLLTPNSITTNLNSPTTPPHPPRKISTESASTQATFIEEEKTQVFPPLKKSLKDTSAYRIIELPNSLKVLLISDKESLRASASLTVNFGAMQDPETHQGLAHLLEHMLFKGSLKYPEEGHYYQFISLNGGNCNAFTSPYNTTYFFDVSSSAFYEALDIFAQFFSCPLLKKECVNREIHAVDSEFQMNFNDDNNKIWHVKKALADENSPFRKFHCGNLGSLKKDGLLTALKNFHEKYYSANQMALVINSPDELDFMQKQVESIFKGVENKEIEAQSFKNLDFPFKNSLKKLVKIVPVNDGNTLEMVYRFESLSEETEELRVYEYISKILAYQGRGSLTDFLIRERLATHISAQGKDEMDFFSTFKIQINLTEFGLENWEKIVSSINYFLGLLNKEGPKEWFFEECRSLAELNFQYSESKETGKNVQNYSQALGLFKDEDMPDFIYKGFSFGKWQPEKISKVLSLLKLENCQIYLISKKFKNEVDTEEIYFKAKYKIEELDQDWLEKIQNWEDFNWKIPPSEYLKHPKANNLIQKNFEILENFEEKKVKKISEKKNSQVYHCLNVKQKDPKVHTALIIYENKENPSLLNTPKFFAYKILWTACFKDYFSADNFLTSYAKCNFMIEQQQKFLIIKGNCFSESLKPFLGLLARRMRTFLNFDPEEASPVNSYMFKTLKNHLIQSLQNSLKAAPYKQGMSQVDWILSDCDLETTKIVKELEKINFENFQKYCCEEIFKFIRFEWFFEGNINEDQAKEYSENFEVDLLKGSNFSNRGQTLDKELVGSVRPSKILKGTTAVLEKEIDIQGERNSAFIKLYELGLSIGENDGLLGPSKVFVLTTVLNTWLHDEYFRDLRCFQQLGYVVFVNVKSVSGVLYLGFCVQSDQKNTHYCAKMTQKFVENMTQKLKMMPEFSFNNLKRACYGRVSQKNSSLEADFEEDLREIISHQFLFSRREERIKELELLTKEDVFLFWEKKFLKEKRCLELHLCPSERVEEGLELKKKRREEERDLRFYKSYTAFRIKQGLYPDFGSLFENFHDNL